MDGQVLFNTAYAIAVMALAAFIFIKLVLWPLRHSRRSGAADGGSGIFSSGGSSCDGGSGGDCGGGDGGGGGGGD